MLDLNKPLVSVLICSYNAEKFVEATVRSVSNQTYANMEILVLDNDSSDETVGVLRRVAEEDPRLKIYEAMSNLGAYGGLNYLLDRAAGRYVAINDHDDIWKNDKIRRQVEFLETNGNYVGCGTAMINHYEKYNCFVMRRLRRIGTVAWHTSLVFRNSGQRYDESIKVATDFHFMKNVLCRNHLLIYNHREPYVLRRIRADHSNLSTKWIRIRNLKEILRAKVNTVDKLALLNRVLLGQTLSDYLVLMLLMRRHILSKTDVEEYFDLEEFPLNDRFAQSL